MFINIAHATGAAADAATMPSTQDAFMVNMVLILVLVVMFYLLLIRPQQKRFKAHADMLRGLEKGTKVVTQGGLVGKIDKFNNDQEVVLDLGSSQKVTVMRSAISGVYDSVPGNDNKKASEKAEEKAEEKPAEKAPKKAAEKKSAAKPKTAAKKKTTTAKK